jgi:hypothetical protein
MPATHPVISVASVAANKARKPRLARSSRRAGDVVWCPPDEKHWHGATSTTAMTHIAIVEQLDGKTVNWMEKVSDEEYQAS